MHPAEPERTPDVIAALEQIPGHAATAAEVWVWEGPVPEVSDHPASWVVLRADDWPMSSVTARALAAALLQAADRVESAVRAGSS